MKKIMKIVGYIVAAIIMVPIAIGLVLKGFSPTVAAPGKLVDVGGYKLHINCIGTESDLPTVIIETGAGTTSPVYHWIASSLSKTGRVCSYDRAGLGWSDLPDLPSDTNTIVAALKTLIDKEGIKKPFAFVGHSIAGIHMRVYTEQYPEDVSAIAFIDASNPNQVEELKMDEDFAADAQDTMLSVARILVQLGLTHIYNPLTAGYALEYPDEIMSQLTYLNNRTENIDAVKAEMAGIPATMKQGLVAGTLGDRPIVVLTAAEKFADGMLPPELDPEVFQQSWFKLQKEIASLSSHSKHVYMKEANHGSIVTDKKNADIVSKHVLEMLQAVRPNTVL